MAAELDKWGGPLNKMFLIMLFYLKINLLIKFMCNVVSNVVLLINRSIDKMYV